jgi:predicted metal-dependent phosphoesterase TrpH
LKELSGWELVLLRTKPLAGRPTVSRALRDRAHVRTLRDGASRAKLLNEASVFVPALDGLDRVSLEAAAAGAAIVSPPGIHDQPELAAAAIARLGEDEAFRERSAARAREDAERHSFAALASDVDEVYEELAAKRKPRAPAPVIPAEQDWLAADLHLHTSWSHDCQIPVEELLDTAEEQGLGAIAVTDHNVFGGALEAVELARRRNLIVIPGEEVKTKEQGEVIGLFLREEIPRGMTFDETVAAIKAQGGIVYVPHPFDRLHAIPDAATLHRNLAAIDILEVYNARLLFEAYNDEALRFARKYGLAMGAGSDAHVVQGIGTGRLRMPTFDGPAEFLAAIRLAQIQRRPRSLLYLQSLKWAAQAKERVR